MNETPRERAVWKYPLALRSGAQRVTLPEGAILRHVHAQGTPTLWFEVDPRQRPEDRLFAIFATGEPFGPDGSYLGTVHIDWMVWHVYEVGQ